jgi:hypothetical protein
MALLPITALAQSSYSIPNPLMKPAAQMATPVPQRDGAPRAVPVQRTSDAQGPRDGPLPQGGPQGLAPLPAAGGPIVSAETAVRDELANYTVTTVVGEAAVMRTNVGYSGPNGQGERQSHSASAGATPSGQSSNRQQVLRVRTGTPLTIGGTVVVPAVQSAAVQFRLRESGPVVHTVYLDSQSAPAYVPPSNTREVIDPSVAARSTPSSYGNPNGSGSASATAPAPGAVPGQPSVR